VIIDSVIQLSVISARLRRKRISAAGFDWSYLVGGHESKPILLLIHGFGADAESNWASMARLLTPHFRVFIPDLTGHGRTTPCLASASYMVSEQVERVSGFVDAVLGTECKFFLAGISMGGHIAGVFSIRYGNRLLATCLMCPAGVEGSRLSEFRRKVVEGKNLLIPTNFDDFQLMLKIVSVKPITAPRHFLEHVFAQRALRTPVFTKVMHDLMKEPLLLQGLLPQLKVPTILMWGKEDQILDPSGVEVFETAVPASLVKDRSRFQSLEYSDCGHFMVREAAARVASDMRQFFDRVSISSATRA